MNKKLVTIALAILLFTGCSTVKGIFGKESSKIQKQQTTIEQVEGKLTDVTANKIVDVSQLSFGVDTALGKITNAPIEVTVASDLNKRVESIAGMPTIEQQSAMVKLVNDLIAQNINGVKELAAEDKQLSTLQSDEKSLLSEKQTQIDKLSALSSQVALKADTTQSELNQYTKWFGLSAIFLGVKQLLFTSVWFILGAMVLFIVLRALAATNPFASAVFGIFQSLGASAIHLIETLIPSSIQTLNEAKADVLTTSNAINSAISGSK